MSDEAAGDAPIEVIAVPADTPAEISVADAVAAYAAAKAPKKPAAESAEEATADPESTDEVDADPLEAAPGEDEDADPDAEELPPVERPRSWSKDADDDWNAIPRDRQIKIAANEQAREADIRSRINKAAEADKAAEAKVAQAEQARQQYEGKAQAALLVLQREQLRDFGDIRTVADIVKMAAEDPFRKIQWDAHQDELRAAAADVEQANARKEAAKQTEQRTRRTTETAKLIEKLPEYADAKKLDAAQKAAAQLFRDVGYDDKELADLGNEPLLDDHRIQLIINDAMKFRAMQSAKAAVVAKVVPPVQRPGSAKPAGAATSERVQTLTRKPELSVQEAVELHNLQQRSARRSA